MKRNVIGLTAAILLAALPAYATNPPAVEWQKSFVWDTAGRCVQQTRDGGHVVVGSFHPGDILSGGIYSDVFLWKTDPAGNTQWWRCYGGPRYDWANTVRQTDDGGYVIGGSSYDDDSAGTAGGTKGVIIKVDPLGNQVWRYADHSLPFVTDVAQTRDGGYAVTGCWSGFDNVRLSKFTAQGNLVWSTALPASYSENWADGDPPLQQTCDGGYIIAVEALLKTDSTGQLEWKKTYPDVTVFFSVQQTADGGFVATGMGPTPLVPWHSRNLILLRTDSLGNKLWMQRYRGDSQSWGLCVRETWDGGFFITGYSGDPWLLRTNSQGALSWAKTLSLRDYAEWGEPTADGGYIVSAGLYLIKLESDRWR